MLVDRSDDTLSSLIVFCVFWASILAKETFGHTRVLDSRELNIHHGRASYLNLQL